jgi:hypothetical protein
MIIINIKGGLGNQMFQYALARKFQVTYPEERVLINTEYFKSKPKDQNISTFPLDINYFQIKNFEVANSFVGIQRRYYKLRDLFYSEKTDLRYKEQILLNKNGYFDGYWQSENYFKDIKYELQNEFQLKDNYWDDISLKLMEEIKTKNSVSIHIRRGDYINLGYDKACNQEYYKDAINIILERIDNPHFFIFSNDLDWVKKNIKIPSEKTYVNNTTNAQATKELILMSNCKNNIIANSTFSWWAAWLNANSEKVVISPKTWIEGLKQSIEVETWVNI